MKIPGWRVQNVIANKLIHKHTYVLLYIVDSGKYMGKRLISTYIVQQGRCWAGDEGGEGRNFMFVVIAI